MKEFDVWNFVPLQICSSSLRQNTTQQFIKPNVVCRTTFRYLTLCQLYTICRSQQFYITSISWSANEHWTTFSWFSFDSNNIIFWLSRYFTSSGRKFNVIASSKQRKWRHISHNNVLNNYRNSKQNVTTETVNNSLQINKLWFKYDCEIMQ